MGDIRVFDLRNGDVVIFFGENYCHDYSKENTEQIKKDIAAYKEGSNPKTWDGNEIEHFSLEDFEEDETVDEISVDTLLETEDSIIEKMVSIIEENISENGGFTDENVGDQMEEFFRKMLPESYSDYDLFDLYKKALEKLLDIHKGTYKMVRSFSDRYGNVGADISYGFDRDMFLKYLMERESAYEGEDTYTKDELEAAMEQIKKTSINKKISL